MDWQELQKQRISNLRDMMKEHLPDVTGVIGMKKEQLVELLAQKLGIEHPHKEVVGIDKTKIRAKIKDLKVQRQTALEAHDPVGLKKQRRAIHRLKRRLRKAEVLK